MKLCENANETYVLPSYKIDEFFAVKNNRIIGWLGKGFDDFLASPAKRKCNILEDLSIGIKDQNNSYSGCLGYIQRNEAMFMLRGEHPFIDESWLRKTTAIHNERFLILQDITNDVKLTKFYNLLHSLIFEKEIYIAFTVTILTLLIIFVLGKIFIEQNCNPKILTKLKRSFIKRLFKYSDNKRAFFEDFFVLLFCTLVWTFIYMVNNNIITNKLVVESSGVIKDEDDIFKTSRTACYLEGDTEHVLALTSPKNSLLARVYEKTKIIKSLKGLNNKRIKDRCLVEKIIENANFQVDDTFGIFSEQLAYSLLRVLSNFKSKKIIWLSQKSVFMLNLHFYYKNSPKYRYYDKVALHYLETGQIVKLTNFIYRVGFQKFISSSTLYTSLEEYKNGVRKFDSLRFENYKFLFLTYFIICLTIEIVFLFVHLRKKSIEIYLRNLLRLKILIKRLREIFAKSKRKDKKVFKRVVAKKAKPEKVVSQKLSEKVVAQKNAKLPRRKRRVSTV